MLRRAAAFVLDSPTERQRLTRTNAQFAASGLSDFLITGDPAAADPDRVLDTLRWGGQLIFASRHPAALDKLRHRFRGRVEFALEVAPTPLPGFDLGAALGRRPRVCVVRKVLLDRPQRLGARQSFDVRLIPDRQTPHRWCVTKRVPSVEQTVARLEPLLPGRSDQHVYRLARKLATKVFPVLLTRETGFLTLLQERLPEAMRSRVPRPLRVMRDEDGRVQRLDMTWLREGGEPISPTAFTRQAATLLDALHTVAGVIHLDLRLDNMVVTEAGVGFVDFGSACLANEPLDDRPMLHALFSSMLSASRIRRDLRRLQRKRLVTSALFRDCYPKRDPAIDLFALALQMTRPWANPAFRGLVTQRDTDAQIDRLLRLQRHVLRPRDPERPEITTAAEIADALAGRIRTRTRDHEPVGPIFSITPQHDPAAALIA
jgi:hypothetical protein